LSSAGEPPLRLHHRREGDLICAAADLPCRSPLIAASTTASSGSSPFQGWVARRASNGVQFGTVDHADPGDAIKLIKDEQGQHHRIPMSWVPPPAFPCVWTFSREGV
jgi:hypothetical protein